MNITPLAFAIHGVPLYPMSKTRETDFKRKAVARMAWIESEPDKNHRKFRISAKEGK